MSLQLCEPEQLDVSDLVNVDHPKHYNAHPKGIECIDVIEEGFSFNIANAIKYLWRAGLKTDSPAEDLNKAIWYIQREVKRLGPDEKRQK